MELEDGMTNHELVFGIETDEELEATEEEEGEGGGQEEGEEEGDDEIDNGEIAVGFEADTNPLDYVNNGDSSGVQLYQQFERLEYEALADKKRKTLALDPAGNLSSKKSRLEETSGATFAEIMEAMNYGVRRRSSRKPKKRGRRKGSRNKLSPEVTRELGDATLHYAHGRYEDAIGVLNEVVRLAPNLPDPYHTLGLVYDAIDNRKKAMGCYMIAAFLSPKNSSLWKLLVTWSIEQGNIGQAWYCLSKAINADPGDITLIHQRASLYVEIGDYQKAAESYEQLVQVCPCNIEALKKAAMLYKRCGKLERAVTIVEDYVKNHPPETDLSMVDLVASLCMENTDYTKAVQHIKHAKELYHSEKEFPLYLTIKAGICHAYLGNMEKAESSFSCLEQANGNDHMDLVMSVADSFMSLQYYESALKYYLKLEGNASHNGILTLKIAQCYSASNKAPFAIRSFYKVLQAHEDDVDTRLTLASLLLEEQKGDEAIALLSPPENSVPGSSIDTDVDRPDPWWLNAKVKLKLSYIYRTKGMLGGFVDAIFPLVHESLTVEAMSQKVKQRKRLSVSVLSERVKVLDENQTDSVFGSFRRPASKNDLLKANRARKLLEKRATSKEEKKAAALAAGHDWGSDESDEEMPQQSLRQPPLPDLLKDEEHYRLIMDLCSALTSLRRYSDALEILKLTLRLAYRTLPAERKEELHSLGAQIALNITDPSDGFDYVRYAVQQRPHSIAAWNCYYKLILRLENRLSKHNKFLHHMRVEHKDLVPPMIISGNQFTMISQHQAAAREYLEAYKLMPENPLINLCVGTALINLALGHRLQNKHQCVAQGLAFLHNNLRLCGDNQEALYNIARAYHHVGLFSLAAFYYEKVLAIPQKDCPSPNLRREAAYNLHLIYKKSGAVDLARQILKDYCNL